MDTNRNLLPKVYLFKKDHDMIEEFVRCRPAEETGGDLFGLWTSEEEPVLHIVTGQGREILQTSSESSLKSYDRFSKEFERLEELLHWKFHLNYMGKWQYMRRSGRNESAIKGVFDQRPPNRRATRLVLLTADYDAASKQVELSLYLFPDVSSPKKGEIVILPGERVFKMEDNVEKLINALVKKSGLKETDIIKKRSEDLPHRNPYKIKSELNEDTGRSECNSGWQKMQTEFLRNQSGLKVYICKEDLEMMENLALRYPHLETGGDLFGLWTNEGDAVVHVVLGPGQSCRRTNVSFYQDIAYLKRNGELLTQNYMLCHLGEWHSHHQLRLFQPSQGDQPSAVIRNYPGGGTRGFLLIIANIVSPNKVTFTPYLYTVNANFPFDQKGTVFTLPYPSVFKKDGVIERSIKEGRETERDFQ